MTTGTGTPLPPDSWPGAGGRRSVAPPVAAWPGAAPKSETPGASWPGATTTTTRPAAPRGVDEAALRDLELRDPAHPVSPKARLMWGLQQLLVSLVPLVLVVGWMLVDDAHRTWQAIAFGVLTLVALLFVVGVPLWRYRVHRWEVTDDAVYTQSGWLMKQRRIAPISRIQTVDSEFGPLEQMFGLGTLTVTTASAAGPLRITGLEEGTVRKLVTDLTGSTAKERGDAT